ncbi:MAG: UDP-N-acetylmuramate--L-alanine ligase [Elusimicrobiota bacterium]
MFKKFKHLHFVGIGGSGMSGIAEVLLNLGFQISGSDLKETDVTQHLQKLGATFFLDHKSENVIGADVVITSSAIDLKNTEVQTAFNLKIPVIPRAEMLAELARLKYAILIGGSHGKTTTTSMMALILGKAGFDPTVVIGGKFKNLGFGGKMGNGEYLVAEADESDGSFLKLSPTMAIVTNIDNDHLDFYGTLDKIKSAFVQFINKIPFYGTAILCGDDPNIQSVLSEIHRHYLTYGFLSSNDYTAKNLITKNLSTSFDVFFRNQLLGSVKLSTPGEQNALNALAGISCGIELGINFANIAEALSEFKGVSRRMEIKGEINGVVFIDDYGHHPTEIKATLKAVRQTWPERRILVAFQPHRYTRTALLWKEFGKVLMDSDVIKLLNIYPAGEKPIENISSSLIVNILQQNKKPAEIINMENSLDKLWKELQPGDIFLTLGAGDVWKLGEAMIESKAGQDFFG